MHIHTSAGGGDYFDLRGVNVLNLENVVRDPRHQQTTFVLIHGGYPVRSRSDAAGGDEERLSRLVGDGADALSDGVQERSFAAGSRSIPEKVTFGSDAFPYNEALGVEEVYWMGVHTTRTALAAALAEMIAAREITETRGDDDGARLPARQRSGAVR